LLICFFLYAVTPLTAQQTNANGFFQKRAGVGALAQAKVSLNKQGYINLNPRARRQIQFSGSPFSGNPSGPTRSRTTGQLIKWTDGAEWGNTMLFENNGKIGLSADPTAWIDFGNGPADSDTGLSLKFPQHGILWEVGQTYNPDYGPFQFVSGIAPSAPGVAGQLDDTNAGWGYNMTGSKPNEPSYFDIMEIHWNPGGGSGVNDYEQIEHYNEWQTTYGGAGGAPIVRPWGFVLRRYRAGDPRFEIQTHLNTTSYQMFDWYNGQFRGLDNQPMLSISGGVGQGQGTLNVHYGGISLDPFNLDPLNNRSNYVSGIISIHGQNALSSARYGNIQQLSLGMNDANSRATVYGNAMFGGRGNVPNSAVQLTVWPQHSAVKDALRFITPDTNLERYLDFRTISGTRHLALTKSGEFTWGPDSGPTNLDVGLLRASANTLQISKGAGSAGFGDLAVRGVKMQTGTANARAGTCTLGAGGNCVVSTSAITANSLVMLTVQNQVGTVGSPYIFSRTPGVSFTIQSTAGGLDNSVVAWVIIEPVS
jgi:hypothetical protein